MTPAADLDAVIRLQVKSLADAALLELGWLGREKIMAMATEPGAVGLGRLKETVRAHVDHASAAIVAAGGGDAELLVRTMLQIFLDELAVWAAQKAQAKE